MAAQGRFLFQSQLLALQAASSDPAGAVEAPSSRGPPAKRGWAGVAEVVGGHSRAATAGLHRSGANLLGAV